ncbi:hypothetical protein HDU78_008446 [Chytriomyces hyalinus]|nr:hypothetical protein HDU78_008446 [Chytriomyces hyalinus]
MDSWNAIDSDGWQFKLIGPQGKVGAGDQWYFRSTGSINGDAGLLPDPKKIAAANEGAVNGKPSTAGNDKLEHGPAGTTATTDVTPLASPTPSSTVGQTSSNSSAPAWQKPVIIGGSILGVVFVFALISFLYTKFKKNDDEEAPSRNNSPLPTHAAESKRAEPKIEQAQRQETFSPSLTQSTMSYSSNSPNYYTASQVPVVVGQPPYQPVYNQSYAGYSQPQFQGQAAPMQYQQQQQGPPVGYAQGGYYAQQPVSNQQQPYQSSYSREGSRRDQDQQRR